MFSYLIDFSYKRTIRQAIGFYIVYFLAVIVISGLVSYSVLNNQVFFSQEDAIRAGRQIGSKVAVAVILLLAILILNAKKFIGDPRFIAIGIGAVVLAYIGGGLLGLIPLAYLTTQEKKHHK
jgi:hypothetical protein